MKIEGVGKIKWNFRTKEGMLTIHSKCYCVPDAKACLISPQQLFNSTQGVHGQYIVQENHSTLIFDGVGELQIDYDAHSHLPIAIAKNLTQPAAQVNLTILNNDNQNLTPAQKLLILWHTRFGHKTSQLYKGCFEVYLFCLKNSCVPVDAQTLDVKYVNSPKGIEKVLEEIHSALTFKLTEPYVLAI